MENIETKPQESAGVTMCLSGSVIGAASGIVYGKAGDEVTVIDDSSEMILVDNSGVRFHVREHQLKLKDPATVITEVEVSEPKPVEPQTSKRPVMHKKAIKQQMVPSNQTKLF